MPRPDAVTRQAGVRDRLDPWLVGSGRGLATEARQDALEGVLLALQAMTHLGILGSCHFPPEVGEIELQAFTQHFEVVRTQVDHHREASFRCIADPGTALNLARYARAAV